MKTRCKLLLLYFNLNGILSLKYSKQKFQISRVFFVFNFLLPFLFTFYFIFPKLPGEVAKTHNVKISKFLYKMSLTIFLQFNVLPFICIWIQLYQRNKILSILSDIFEYLRKHLSECDVGKIVKEFLMNLMIFLFFLLAKNILSFFAFLNFSWKSLLVVSFLQWNDFVPLYFLQFIFLILTFVKISVESLKRHYHEEKFKANFDVIKMESKFLELHEIMVGIEKTFGFLLSIVVLLLVFLVSSTVS